jgi:hypothetical protein
VGNAMWADAEAILLEGRPNSGTTSTTFMENWGFVNDVALSNALNKIASPRATACHTSYLLHKHHATYVYFTVSTCSQQIIRAGNPCMGTQETQVPEEVLWEAS